MQHLSYAKLRLKAEELRIPNWPRLRKGQLAVFIQKKTQAFAAECAVNSLAGGNDE